MEAKVKGAAGSICQPVAKRRLRGPFEGLPQHGCVRGLAGTVHGTRLGAAVMQRGRDRPLPLCWMR